MAKRKTRRRKTKSRRKAPARKSSGFPFQQKAFMMGKGLTCGIILFALAILGMFGYGSSIVLLLADLFPGYNASIFGAVIGLVYGIITGYLIGYVFIWAYGYAKNM